MITLVAYLYGRDYIIRINLYDYTEVVVFYEKENEMIGIKQNVSSNSIEEVINYLTLKRNSVDVNYNSPLDANIKLLKYLKENDILTLYFNKEYDALNEEEKADCGSLLYESFYLQGYKTLIIKTEDDSYVYNENTVFSLFRYDNYQIKDLDGKMIRIYDEQEDKLFFYAIIDEYRNEVDYKMNFLFNNIDYSVNKNNISINYDDEKIDFKWLKKVISLNFSGYNFTYTEI